MTILSNALSGALASQMALSATSQNIANLQTEGYTRQSALLTTRGSDGSAGSAGTGVQVSALLRYSESYKSQQMWRTGADVGQYANTQPYLTQLEQVMGDDTANLSAAIDDFFASLNAVAGDSATSTPLRQQVLTSAESLAQRFNSLNSVFNAQQVSISQQRSALVESANANITKIAALNAQISLANATGKPPSALIDARDLAIDELSSQMALEVSDHGNGLRDVSLKTGQALVIGNVGGTLNAVGGTSTQYFTLDFASTTFQLDAAKLGGSFGGLTLYEQGTLLPMQQAVTDIARQFSDKINTQLQAGYAVDGSAGKALFALASGTSVLSVVDNFDANDLAFSSDGTPGDTGNLLKLVTVNAERITVTGIGSVLLGDADTQLVGKLGVLSQQNQAALTTAETMRSHAVSDWQSTSGVNEDEEAVNLVAYQNMYQANMKVMTVANALFDATLAMMG